MKFLMVQLRKFKDIYGTDFEETLSELSDEKSQYLYENNIIESVTTEENITAPDIVEKDINDEDITEEDITEEDIACEQIVSEMDKETDLANV